MNTLEVGDISGNVKHHDLPGCRPCFDPSQQCRDRAGRGAGRCGLCRKLEQGARREPRRNDAGDPLFAL
jgi:hypothetical protein